MATTALRLAPFRMVVTLRTERKFGANKDKRQNSTAAITSARCPLRICIRLPLCIVIGIRESILKNTFKRGRIQKCSQDRYEKIPPNNKASGILILELRQINSRNTLGKVEHLDTHHFTAFIKI